jgi:glucan biosynthesis protein
MMGGGAISETSLEESAVLPLRAQTVAFIAALILSGAQARAQNAAAPPPPHVEPFSFATVAHLAQQRSQQPYRDRSAPLSQRLAKLSYDAFRDIRFKPAAALWHDQALFEVQFFHRGFTFARQVNINEVNAAGTSRPIQSITRPPLPSASSRR